MQQLNAIFLFPLSNTCLKIEAVNLMSSASKLLAPHGERIEVRGGFAIDLGLSKV